MVEDGVRELSDREAIRGVMDLYCLALFKADPDLLLKMYWPEAQEEHGDYRGSAQGFVAQFAPVLLGRLSTVANVSYRNIEFRSPDEAVAGGFGSIVVVTGAAEDPSMSLVATRYEDVLQKRDGTWRIIRRKANMVAKRAL